MRTLEEAIQKMGQTLKDKGNQYGKTYLKVSQALGVLPQYSILVRILEKCFRVANLCERHSTQPIHLEQEFMDIACYAILAAFESSSEEE